MAEATMDRQRQLRASYLTTAVVSPFNVSFEEYPFDSRPTRPARIHTNHARQLSAASTASDTLTNGLTPSSINSFKKYYEDPDEPYPSNASTTTVVEDTPTQPKPKLPTLLCFAALTLSIFLVALDTVLIPTALPTIALDFHIPDSLFAWTGSAYLLANAASTPFWGKLSDVFGRKPIILISNTIFLGGSILCAVSNSAIMLVSGRAVQGLGGGGVVVLVHVCVTDLFSIRDRSFYLGIIGAVWAVASALGPVVGGIFAEKLHWRWCFYINLPIISISTVLLFFTLNIPHPKTPLLSGLLSMDWAGSITILAATLFLLIGLQLGGESTYASTLVIVFLVFGFVLFLVFPLTQWLSEKRGLSPTTPLRIFKDLSNLCALGVCACDALVFNSVAYFLPLYFQLILAVDPSTAGLYMLAIAIPLAIVSFITGYIIEKTGRFLEVLQLGLFIMTIGIGLLISLGVTIDLGKIIGFLIVVGIGFGPNFHAPLIALQTRIKEADIASGVSAFGFVRMVSGAIGVVVGQVVFQILMRPHFDDFVGVGIPRDMAERLAGGEAISESVAVAALPDIQRGAVRGGMTSALRGTWIVFTIVSALGLLVSFGIKRSKLAKENDNAKVPQEKA